MEHPLTTKNIKTFVLDTNVLLSDPNAIFSFQENNVILPLIVIEELDRHKSDPTDVGKNARENHRRISQFSNLKEGAQLPNGGGILKVVTTTSVAELPADLSHDLADNIILSVCLGLKQSSPNDQVILVTQDMLLKIKGEALGVVCQGYTKYNIVDSANSLYSGVAKFTGVVPGFVKEFFANESAGTKTELPPEFKAQEPLFPNQFLVIKEGEGQSAIIGRYKGPTEGFTRLEDHTAYGLKPRNKEQNMALDLLLDPNVKLVSLVGLAGCGKTLLAVAAGLEQVINSKKYKRMVISRPIQPLGKDLGYLPGTLEEKMEPWLSPVKDNVINLMFKGKKGKSEKDTLQMFIDNGTIEIEAITYIRGRSIADAIIIIDEAQNLSVHELKTIITRVGENTKIILTGDIEQIDNVYLSPISNGLTVAVEKFKDSFLAGHVSLIKGERSELATLAAKML